MDRENGEADIDLIEPLYALRKKTVVIIPAALLGGGFFSAYSFTKAKPAVIVG